jgi:hypothetical protein
MYSEKRTFVLLLSSVTSKQNRKGTAESKQLVSYLPPIFLKDQADSRISYASYL